MGLDLAVFRSYAPAIVFGHKLTRWQNMHLTGCDVDLVFISQSFDRISMGLLSLEKKQEKIGEVDKLLALVQHYY